ncbi:MAG: CPBP family intramembrane metalloprotease [Clostridia bacterium]|nr:CPBP family intramembrane metalloprotease [Clostridia bacterium]
MAYGYDQWQQNDSTNPGAYRPDPSGDLIPVFSEGRPVYKTIQLFDGYGQPLRVNGQPVYRFVQRFIKNGRHVYVALEEHKDSEGRTFYLPGTDEFAVESDLSLISLQTAEQGLSRPPQQSFGGAPYGLTPVLSPDRGHDLLTSSAYKRAGLGLVAVSLVMSSVSSALMTLGLYLCMFLAGKFENLSDVLRSLYGGGLSDSLNGITDSPALSLFVWIITFSSVIGLGLGMLAERLILSNRHYEPVPKNMLSFGTFMLFVAVSLGLWSLGVFIGNFADIFFPFESAGNALEQIETMGPVSLPLHIYAVLGAPVLEELACRKLLLDRLHKYGQLPAAVVSALLFGLLHGNSGQFFLATFLGFVFAIVYLKTGNVLYTMALHAIINFTATVPSILYWFGIDVSRFLYLVFMPVMFAVGIILAVVKRKTVFSLTGSVCEKPARQVFVNPGMMIAMIGGTVSIYANDFLSSIIPAVMNNPAHLVSIISMLLVPVVILIGIFIAGRKPVIEEPAAEGPAFEEPSFVEPSYEGPSVEESSVEGPAAEEPVVENAGL